MLDDGLSRHWNISPLRDDALLPYFYRHTLTSQEKRKGKIQKFKKTPLSIP